MPDGKDGTMTQKERLIELLLMMPEIRGYETADDFFNGCADYLLKNGVIVPKCKIGDVLYYMRENLFESGRIDRDILKVDIYEITIDGAKDVYYSAGCDDPDDVSYCVAEKDIGRKAFFTRAEAEQALKERDNE